MTVPSNQCWKQQTSGKPEVASNPNVYSLVPLSMKEEEEDKKDKETHFQIFKS